MTTARPSVAPPWLALASVAALLALGGCARDGADWKSAQDADTQEAYDAFLAEHPDSEFAPRAKERAAQLVEERDWAAATQSDTPEAYQKFVGRHPDGKWTQEARIRIENFNVMAAAAPEVPVDAAPAARPGAPASAARPVAAAASGAPAAAATAAPAVASARPAASKSTPASTAPAGAATAAAASGTAASAPAAIPASATSDTPAATAAPTTAPATPAAGYRVQLGAFSSVDKAEAEWARARGKFAALQALEPRITAAQTQAGRLFRLQAGLPDEAEAKRLCATLKEAGQACLVVPPR